MQATGLVQSRQLLILLLQEAQSPVEVRKNRSWHWEQITLELTERVQVWQLLLALEQDWQVLDVEFR